MTYDATALKERLLDKARFLEFQASFIEGAIKEASDESTDSTTSDLMRSGLQMLAKENARIVFQFSESPIETIFLNSLSICFIRNLLPLVLTPPMKNAKRDLADFYNQLDQLATSTAWYGARHKDEKNLNQYLDDQVRRGRMSPEERPYIGRLILFYHWFPFRSAYHITLQASFPDVLIDGSSIRVDALAWLPNRPDWNIAVECDGFQFHSSQEVFTRDRRKDRALKAIGVDVHRFSGAEINQDPAGSANALFAYLLDHQPDA